MKGRLLYVLVLLAFASYTASAQVKISDALEVDKTVHNFGDIKMKGGPVSCTFTLTNTSNEPAVIYQVVTSCGCTDASWTKEPIMPNKSGKVSVKYSNDEGPYPFDKTITVYISSVNKPVLLKVRGVSVDVTKTLEESYPEAAGPLALKTFEYNISTLEQGKVKTDAALVANLSNQPLEVSFKDVSENLEISVSPNPIPARSTAEISFSVKADRKLWGNNKYYATPVSNGNVYGDQKLCIKAFTRENFEHLSSAERSAGPKPRFDESTFQAGMVKQGETIHAEFTFLNEGTKPFGVYKVNIDAPRWAHSRIPPTEPGKKTTFTVDIDTSPMPKGEMMVVISLVTNSPLRPIVNIFITAYIQ